MLKQPDRIVIYPQRDNNLDYLLCWIPPREYNFVSGGSPEVKEELEDLFPTGIEAEFSLDGFEEFGISFPHDQETLRLAYITLAEAGIFAELDFVNLKRLQEYVIEQQNQPIQDLLKDFSDGSLTLEDLKKNPVFKRLLAEPKTRGGEDPGEAFQKLSGQMNTPEG